MYDYSERMQAYKQAVESYLDGCFTADLSQRVLFDAMRYSLLAGGKRIRPVLVMEFCRVCGGDWKKAVPFAASLEMIHTYSLIHDDLPCMDDDDYRRGRLTNHKIYGEATAVLAGDGLLTAAFENASSADCDAKTALKIINILASEAGELGMVGGQVLDMEGETRPLDEEEVHRVHELKTGALICAACLVGCTCGGATAKQLEAAKTYAKAIGLAFQIRDDMLDVLGDAEKLGKKTHMDESKTTFVTLYGVGECSKLIERETKKAIEALSAFEDTEFLADLAQKLAIRDY